MPKKEKGERLDSPNTEGINKNNDTTPELKLIHASKLAKDKKEYLVSDFVIPVSDKNGHNGTEGFKCQYAYSRRIDVILATKKFPYSTRSDVLRHALHRHLDWLSEIEPEIPNMASLELVNDIIKAAAAEREFTSSFEGLCKEVQSMQNKGATEEAQRMVKNALRQAKQMNPSYWTGWYIQQIEEKFAALLKKESE